MKILTLMFGLILAVSMALSAYAAPVPVTVGEVKVDGYNLDAGLTTSVRQLERGEDFDVRIRLTATADVENIQINAFITGFEHSKSEPISDSTRAFDLATGETAVKTLDLSLPERADEDTYLLRLIISDRSNDAVTAEYGIKVQPSDTQVIIKDFELSPEDEVQAGRAILATVRVKNLGDSDEDDVKIKVSIPELGVSATPDYINELEEDESATSEEFFLKINSCTKPGIYEVVAEVEFDEGDEEVTATKAISVTKGICDVVEEPGQAQVSGKTTIAYSTEAQSIVAGSSAASYPVTITNSGASTKAFMLSVDSADWASFRVSPSNLVTVKSGQTQTMFVLASANAGTQAGERVFTVSIKDSTGNVLQNLAMKADVVAASAGGVGNLSSLRNALTAGLVVIVAILVVIGLLLAFRRVRGGEEGGESQTYY